MAPRALQCTSWLLKVKKPYKIYANIAFCFENHMTFKEFNSEEQ